MPTASQVTRSAETIRSYFEGKDYQALKRIATRLGSADPLKEEFEIQLENLKQEAIKHFDQERFAECLETFRFLRELEPENEKIRSYLKLCQEMMAEATVPEKREARKPEVGSATPFPRDDTPLRQPAFVANVQRQKPIGIELHPGRQDAQAITANRAGPRLVSILIVAAIVSFGIGMDLCRIHWLARATSVNGPIGEPDAGSVSAEETESRPLNLRAKTDRAMEPKPIRASTAAFTATGQPSLKRNPVSQSSHRNVAYPVIHDHLLGGCHGSLTINDKWVTFSPTGNAKHSFVAPTRFVSMDRKDMLIVKFKNKTYRFKAASTDSDQQLEAIRQHWKTAKRANGEG